MKKLRLSRRDYLTAHSDNPVLVTVHRLRHAVGWLLVAASALFVALNLQLFTPESLRNIASSVRAASQVSAGDTTVISYPTGTVKCSAPFGNGLAVCTDKQLTFQLPSKYCQMESALSFASPVMRASSQYLLVFDRKGYRFTVTNTLSEVYGRAMTSPIINADIAADGTAAIVTDEAGYKSAVTVYSADNRELYNWSSPDYYIMSAVLSADGQRLAMFCFRQNGLTLETRLMFTDINSEEKTEVDMNSNLVLGMRFLGNNTVCVVCDTATYVVSRNGDIHYQTEYATDDLIAFDLTENYLALVTEAYSQTSRAEVVLINARGAASRTPLSLPTEPDSVSYCDGRLAVLTGDTVTFYSKSLREIDCQSNLAGVSRVYMRSGGTAIALFGGQARVLSIGNPLTDLDPHGD